MVFSLWAPSITAKSESEVFINREKSSQPWIFIGGGWTCPFIVSSNRCSKTEPWLIGWKLLDQLAPFSPFPNLWCDKRENRLVFCFPPHFPHSACELYFSVFVRLSRTTRNFFHSVALYDPVEIMERRWSSGTAGRRWAAWTYRPTFSAAPFWELSVEIGRGWYWRNSKIWQNFTNKFKLSLFSHRSHIPIDILMW